MIHLTYGDELVVGRVVLGINGRHEGQVQSLFGVLSALFTCLECHLAGYNKSICIIR